MKRELAKFIFIKRGDNTFLACQKSINKLVELALAMNLKV